MMTYRAVFRKRPDDLTVTVTREVGARRQLAPLTGGDQLHDPQPVGHTEGPPQEHCHDLPDRQIRSPTRRTSPAGGNVHQLDPILSRQHTT